MCFYLLWCIYAHAFQAITHNNERTGLPCAATGYAMHPSYLLSCPREVFRGSDRNGGS